MADCDIAPAQAGDEAAIRGLLQASGLPASDLGPSALGSFLVLRDADGRLAGVVGLEIGPGVALLRSLAVDPLARTRGAGAALTQAAEALARDRGACDVYLLTTTADRYFSAQGYAAAPRDEAPPFIRATTQFSGLCPSSATFMRKRL